MESDVDSEGEDLEMIRPTIIRELRNVLDEYPDDGQIFKELIQNAEDAGATTVKILTDIRAFHHDLDPAVVKRHPHLKFFQGPALCVYNDAQFTERDWEGIRMLHTSVKEKDPLKVGRFGLGFKSVFHLTDRLVILSGSSMLYMDPFRPEDRYCKRTRLVDKKETSKELESLLKCLEGVFGATKETFSAGSGGFPGTLFWFPLRQKTSELSSTVYTQQKVHDLLTAFKAEATSMLLFLNNIQRVTIFTRSEACGPAELFTVGLKSSCLDKVCGKRQTFLSAIKEAGEDLPQEGCYCLTEVIIETVDLFPNRESPDHSQSSQTQSSRETDPDSDDFVLAPDSTENDQNNSATSLAAETVDPNKVLHKSQRWLVVSYHAGRNEISEELLQLCSDPELCYRPYVGVAAPLTNLQNFQSQIFCFLPLPLDTRSPTGLPVHVHGYFAVSQNRRHLKWPTADQLSLRGQLDAPLQWNCLLVHELLPRVYLHLLTRLKTMKDLSPQQFYAAWPDLNRVNDRWKSLLQPLYIAMSSKPSFYSPCEGGQWVSLKKAVLEELCQPAIKQLGDEVKEVTAAVAKVYAVNEQKLVRLPEHVRTTLRLLKLLRSAEMMTAKRVSELLLSSLPHLSRADRLHVLRFLCCHDDALYLVQGQELLPLADGTFTTFEVMEEWSPMIHLCEKDLQDLFPGLEYKFCYSDLPPATRACLYRLAQSGKFTLQILDEADANIPDLIEESLQVRFEDEKPTLPKNDTWIKRIWEFLANKDLTIFRLLSLLPEEREGRLALLPLSGAYLCSSARGMTPLTPDLTSCLTKLGVKVLPELPNYITRHKDVLGHWVHFPTPQGILTALKLASSDATIATKRFNKTSSTDEREALIVLLVETRNEKQSPLQIFEHLKLFNEVNAESVVSVKEVSVIAPDLLPPVTLKRRMLSCNHLHRCAATRLGAKDVTLLEIVKEVAELMHSDCSQFSSTAIISFMKFVLCNKTLTTDSTLLGWITTVKFVPTASGELKMAKDLYDPTSPLLRNLFLGERKVPCEDFQTSILLNMLKVLGLREEYSLNLRDIICTSQLIEDLIAQGKEDAAEKKANSLWEILCHHGQQFDEGTLRQISSKKCLPCLQSGDRPAFYPKSVPFSPSCRIAKPQDLCHLSEAMLIGSLLPVAREGLPGLIANTLQLNSQLSEQNVLRNLDNIITYYQSNEAAQYRLILCSVFHFLGQRMSEPAVVQTLTGKKCVLLESGDGFAKPDSFWVERSEDDVKLEPYRFLLPSDVRQENELFRACGASARQDINVLISVLLEIESYHRNQTRSKSEFNRDFKIVKQILDALSKCESATKGNVLLPICHSEPTALRFRPAKDCTVISFDGVENVSSFTGDTEISIVHHKIHHDTAVTLGALKMKDRALTGVEDLDFGYEQREELTNRLHDLLENSYTDGFSVPKELIQNADDAGATEICFLLDERENKDARKNLITDSLDSLQGPALWAYNDATFSDADFENIIKLGAGTKKDDSSKVGRFGLGFNSVYNLTDVPSFISRHTLAMFDPHVKYLKRGAGLKLDFRRDVNRALLSRMPQQFQPFQGVFGCQLKNDTDVHFDGTLFRFPLRTEDQAADSKIKNESYSINKRRQLLKMLLQRAGCLLLFTQNVKTLKVFYLPRDSTDPSSPQCLLDLTKTSSYKVLQPAAQMAGQTILQYFTNQWKGNTDIQIVENVKIEITVTQKAKSVCEVEAHNSTTKWRLAWASGVDQSAAMARKTKEKGLVPLATVAALLGETGLDRIENSPPGFYKSGHLFCFMPLPADTVALENLLVHVNGTFAISSSRKNVLVHSDEDLDSKGAAWNSALIADAVSRAYLLLLENVKSEAAMDIDFRHFFDLWPEAGGTDLLLNSFYARLLTDQNKVLPVPRKNIWVTFSQAWFLEPGFRASECGTVAWNILSDFWNRHGSLVDAPINICSMLIASGGHEVSALEFYMDFFFANIESNYFESEERDKLVLHAISIGTSTMEKLLQKYRCIPCTCPEEIGSTTAATCDMNSSADHAEPTTSSDSLQRIQDLYDSSSSMLLRFFRKENRFPRGDFARADVLHRLKEFGLNGERRVRSQHVIETANLIEELWNQQAKETAVEKAEGLWEILQNHGQNFSADTVEQISSIQCLPCLKPENRPEIYPLSLPFGIKSNLARPNEMCHSSQALLAASQLQVMRKWISSEKILQHLHVGRKVNTEIVLQHLDSVIGHYKIMEAKEYKFVLSEIFQYLEQDSSDFVVTNLRTKTCVLTDHGDSFAEPGALWVDRAEDDIQMKPYRYQLPNDLQMQRDLFIKCGATLCQNTKLLQEVLVDIRNFHTDHSCDQTEMVRDMNLVCQILEKLVKNKSHMGGTVLLPILHNDPNVLRFKQARDCTVIQTDRPDSNAFFTNEQEIFYVHPEIHPKTAVALGALNIKDRALTGVEGLDFDYDQTEDLTTRIHNLLEESYTDGFSVPKELIQNADDAGATEVCFLLDERDNENARKNLITDNMDSLQGPAFWAYNDATFSDIDFENIRKLGEGTKKEDATKVGRFGLGFNSVYNLTDVPCFFSRHTMAMFDPHKTFLKKKGLKMDFRRPVNQALLSRMPGQFLPYQDIFDCHLQNAKEVYYNGTLFRFPFRTEEQARHSKIKNEGYSEKKRREFLKMLLDNAGSLLTFTQSVNTIKVYYLPRDCSDPSARECLLDLTKTSQRRVMVPEKQLGDQTTLQYFTKHWPKTSDIQILEDMSIEMTVTEKAQSLCKAEAHSSSTHWRLAWASGVDQSAALARGNKQEGLVPLAAVAALVEGNALQSVQNSPHGFYKSGRYFCFLPLPESTVRGSVPVHVNAPFALSSSRRSLQIHTEEDLHGKGAAWNDALFADPVSRAYLLLLENVQAEAAVDTDFSRFFKLWPLAAEHLTRGFMKRLIADRNKVFPVREKIVQWSAFSEARFLDLTFRESSCGDIAWQALQHFWTKEGHLVDVPASVYYAMEHSDQTASFTPRIIRENMFYRESFFPNIRSKYWKHQHRDEIVQHALLQEKHELNELLKSCPCIPCSETGALKQPEKLIHPGGEAAKLYTPSDGRFPQGSPRDEKPNSKVNFCSEKSLACLLELGMISNELPWDMLLERATSVSGLASESDELARSRACQIIGYLSSARGVSPRIKACTEHQVKDLSTVKFLPVLNKPPDWPFPWASEKSSEVTELAAPCELYSDSLMNLVACHQKVVDSKALKLSPGSLAKAEVLKVLGLHLHEDSNNMELFQISVQQLQTVAGAAQEKANITTPAQGVCFSLYAFMTKCLACGTSDDKQHVLKQLFRRKVVWTECGFVLPSQVAFKFPVDCRPYRFQLETSFSPHRSFFRAIGVRETFDAENLSSLLTGVYRQFDGKQLPDDMVGLVSRVAQQLCEYTQSDVAVYLPDRQGYMRPTSNLCLDDCEWLKETETMKFVSGKVPNDAASRLGVQSKRKQDFESISESIPFGQREKLSNRIKGLLQGYTFDSSLFKELLQNADDAGATEIKFIKDWRHLSHEKVFEGCESLQGPALSVYNNKSFTKQDMEGLQNLGQGSKKQNLLKTGQYGVGFNAVYHITDVPSFWTLEDDEKETICILDPNCCYVSKTASNTPGIKLKDINRVREAYPDVFAGYLEKAVDMTHPGTLFRFPLRTEQMAKKSEIKNEPVTVAQINHILGEFGKEMHSCLLFLNNLKKIGIYSVKPDGSLETENEINIEMTEGCTAQAESWKCSLEKVSRRALEDTATLTEIPCFEACTHKKVHESRGWKEDWLVVQRIGFKNTANVTGGLQQEWRKDHFQLLPQGGVAVKLAERSKEEKRVIPKPSRHQAFCMLPLPVITSLPMHTNGHFVLDHETRRNLWENKAGNKSDTKTEWNELIASQVIVPAYISALQNIQKLWFSSPADLGWLELMTRLTYYHKLFPALDLDSASTQFWVQLQKKIYIDIAAKELSIFPVLGTGQTCSIEWAPVVSSTGFPGYFNNLTMLFSNAPDKPKDRHVNLSQGGVQQAASSQDSSMWVNKKANDLKALLKDVNMKVLEAPFCIFENFKKSGVADVGDISPESVKQFLKSANTKMHGSCNLTNLPQPLVSTPLKTAAKVRTLLTFIRSLLHDLEGLPLCLRQSGKLYIFADVQGDNKPIVSRDLHLLPGSADLFLHADLLEFFHPICDQVQTWVKKLDLQTLVRLLPQSLREDSFKTGQHCQLDSKILSHSWLQRLWGFIESRLGIAKNTEPEHIRKRAEKNLQSLMEWNFIPVKQCIEGEEKLLLYPLKNMHEVVFLSKNPDESDRKLWDALRSQQLPFLNTDVLSSTSITASIVASISHPHALLKALSACACSLNLGTGQARSILAYFSRNLTGMIECATNKARLQQMLRCLPLYSGVDKKLRAIPVDLKVLCLDVEVPNDGLMEWAQKQKLVLLKENMLPDDLRCILQVDALAAPEFYYQCLLPTLNFLPRSAIPNHMMVIKTGLFNLKHWQKVQAVIIQQLRTTEFIEVDDELNTADTFYSPHHPVFGVMCLPDDFPPDPYCTLSWEPFMKAAGMISEVSENMFVRFAKALECEGSSALTIHTTRKAEVLVKDLFSRKGLNPTFLQQIKDICFVCPSEWRNTEEGQILCEIAKPFCAERLVSFAESCREQDRNLVWSSCTILHPHADPETGQHLNQNILGSHLGVQKNVPKEKVMQHLQTVCTALDGDTGKKLFESSGKLHVIRDVMKELYKYFQESTDDNDVAFLKPLPIICDFEKKQMLKPENVVMNLRDEEEIQGHITQAPRQFGEFSDFFKRLGAVEHVTANHYAIVLSRLKQETAENVLHVEEFKQIVQTAVRELFNCLRSKQEEMKTLTVSHVYLPSQSLCLVKSTHLAFADDVALGKRITEMPQDIHFFLDFGKLDIQFEYPLNELKLLPGRHQLQFLSRILQEAIPEDVKRRAKAGAFSRGVVNKLCNQDFVEVVVRLAYNRPEENSQTFTRDNAEQIKRSLSHISVLETTDLKTVLIWKDTVLNGSEKTKKTVADKVFDDSRSCTVYLDKDYCKNSGIQSPDVIRTCRIAVEHAIGVSVNTSYLEIALQSTEQAMTSMDDDRLKPCDFSARDNRTVFPPPGTLIPLHYHCYLDNNFTSFYNGEHVGFEEYDPQVDNWETDENDPVYVYAIVVEEVKQDGTVSLLGSRYRIDLGSRGGITEVSVTELYRFIRKPDQGSSKPLVKYKGRKTPKGDPKREGGTTADEASDSQAGSTTGEAPPAGSQPEPQPQPEPPPQPEPQPDPEPQPQPKQQLDFKAVMKEIREILNEAWQKFDEQGWKRVIKRLYLKWHPDKNRDNQTFCTKVFQLFQDYVNLLKDNKELPDDDDDQKQNNASSSSRQPPSSTGNSSSSSGGASSSSGGASSSSGGASSSSGNSSSSFFENMHRRSRSYREDFESNSRRRSNEHRSSAGHESSHSHHRFREDDFESHERSHSHHRFREDDFESHARSHRHHRFQEDDFESFHDRSYNARRANPQPGEARLWFRQAKADLGSAQATVGSYDKGYNWICLQCYQAVEKALKAVLYHRDANSSCLAEQSLSVLAKAVGDETLHDLARRLEKQVKNYNRMCYPNVSRCGSIPADVYTADDAALACDVAARVLGAVRAILGA